MSDAIIIAKIIESKNRPFSVADCAIEIFDEAGLVCNRATISCLSFQVEEHLMKHYNALLVSTEEYDEYVDPFLPLIVNKEKEEEDARRERIRRAKFAAEQANQQQQKEERKRYLAWLEDYISDYASSGYKDFKKDWLIRKHGVKSAYYREGPLPDWLKDDLGYVPDEPLDHGMPWDRPRNEVVLSDEEYANKLLAEAREGVDAIEHFCYTDCG